MKILIYIEICEKIKSCRYMSRIVENMTFCLSTWRIGESRNLIYIENCRKLSRTSRQSALLDFGPTEEDNAEK